MPLLSPPRRAAAGLLAVVPFLVAFSSMLSLALAARHPMQTLNPFAFHRGGLRLVASATPARPDVVVAPRKLGLCFPVLFPFNLRYRVLGRHTRTRCGPSADLDARGDFQVLRASLLSPVGSPFPIALRLRCLLLGRRTRTRCGPLADLTARGTSKVTGHLCRPLLGRCFRSVCPGAGTPLSMRCPEQALPAMVAFFLLCV